MGIDTRKPEHQQYITYNVRTAESMANVDAGTFDLVFFMNATRMDQVRELAEKGIRLPQKATYFYPKLLSGLVINRFRSMKIISAEFMISAVSDQQYPRGDLPEIAFVGRSNVGKSSLINSLLNRKKLVKTSATPGKTQMINFFDVNHEFVCADLPGYGFAKVPKPFKKNGRAWSNSI